MLEQTLSELARPLGPSLVPSDDVLDAALMTGSDDLRRCSDFWFKLVCSSVIGVPCVFAQIRTTSAQQRRRRRLDDCEEKEILSLLVGCGTYCVYNGDLDRSNSLRCLTSNGLSVSSHSREQKATTDIIK